ncbi:hypothetical protein [Streptomyces sp. PKU-MA01144]|uniref:hypothetical protein n=1 Tax=Streptomyces sp. PKU-MA01144 TaxID=2729138 RepID=UPI002810B4B2|nr:hypothetical protein [Streptomyces sp. PKU-MA01144]
MSQGESAEDRQQPSEAAREESAPGEAGPADRGSGVTRRGVIAAAGAAGVLLAVSQAGLGGRPREDLLGEPTAADGPVRVVSLVRQSDMVDLTLALWNCSVETGGGQARLVRVDEALAAFVVVHFGPQAVTERAFLEASGGGNEPPTAAPVPTRISGTSRLAFDVTGVLPLDFTVDELLDWARFTPRLVPNALPRTAPGTFRSLPRRPDSTETSLELPWRLQLSPAESGGWAHSADPVTHGSWTEVWETRLGVRERQEGGDWRVAEAPDAEPFVRAVWASDPGFENWLTTPASVPSGDTTDGLRTALVPRDRYDIVRLSGDYSLRTVGGRGPAPIEVERLALGALGAGYDMRGEWDPVVTANYSSTTREWTHRGALGRDHHVRVVSTGFLYPFGHRAAVLSLTERTSQRPSASSEARAAYLRKRLILVVRQPVKSYSDDADVRNAGRRFPFRRVRLLTARTPPLEPATGYVGGGPAGNSYVPRVGGSAYRFHLRGTDWAGRDVDFVAPLVFVSDAGARSSAHLQALHAAYHTDDPLRTAGFGGRTVALAQPGAHPGDTELPVESMVFTGEAPRSSADTAAMVDAGRAPFYPALDRLTATLPVVRELSGDDPGPGTFSYHDAAGSSYVLGGFGAQNPGEVFLAATPGVDPVQVGFPADRSGGVVTAEFAIAGVSRSRGPVAGDAHDAARNLFDPRKMYPRSEARLAGGLELKDLLKPQGATPNPEQAFELTARQEADADGRPVMTELRSKLTPELRAWPSGVNLFVPADPKKCLTVDTRVTSRTDAPTEVVDRVVKGELKNFTINLWGTGATRFVTLDVARFRFVERKDAKTEVDCDIRTVSYHGALKFVDALSRYCTFLGWEPPTGPPTGGGSSARTASFRRAAGAPAAAAAAADEHPSAGQGDRYVDVSPQGVALNRTFAVPEIQLGAFALTGLSVYAGVVIPFDGKPIRVRFAFSSRDKPFSVVLSFLGGGGFAAVELGLGGVEMLEFSFEVKASYSFAIGSVVSGAVEAKAGVYFSVESAENGDQACELTAYLQFSGAVSVLGLVTLSLVAYLALSYYDTPERLVGEATVSVSVDLFFFSFSNSYTVRRELIKGSGRSDGASARADRGSGARSALAASPTAVGTARMSFGDTLTRQEWLDQYCAAFAPVGA